MHQEAFAFIARAARDVVARRLRIIEIGSRDVNGSIRPVFAGHEYTGLDIEAGEGVDVVADGATWGETAAFDLGVCCEVLEHAPNAAEIVANLRRIVRPGGLLLLTAATHGRHPHSVNGCYMDGPEPYPEYYRNVDPGDLHRWLDGCPYVNVEVDTPRGDVRAVATLPRGDA